MKDSGAADVDVEELGQTLPIAIVVRRTSSSVNVVDALFEGRDRKTDAAPVALQIGTGIAAVDVNEVTVPRTRVDVVVHLPVHPDLAIVQTRLRS